MKLTGILLLFIINWYTGFAQVDTARARLPDSLQLKFKKIDDYVKWADTTTRLKKITRTDYLANGPVVSSTEYMDTLTNQIVKKEGDLPRIFIAYYLNGRIVYKKELRSQFPREFYYQEDGSLFHTSFDLDKEPIASVSYIKYEPNQVWMSLTVTKDSIHYLQTNSKSKKRYIKHKTNTISNWNNLISLIKPSSFAKFKFNESTNGRDGQFVKISINTTDSGYSIIYKSEDHVRLNLVWPVVETLQAQARKFMKRY